MSLEVVTEVFGSYIMYILRVKEDVVSVRSDRCEIIVRYLRAKTLPNSTFYLMRSCLIHHPPSMIGG